MLSFLFCLGGGVEDGLEVRDICLGSLESKVSLEEVCQKTRLGSPSEWNILSSVVVYGVSQFSMVLKFMGGVKIGEGSGGSGDWGLYSSSCRIPAIVASTLDGLGGKLISLRLGCASGCWLPNTYGKVASLESESIVTLWCSGEATEETVFVSFAIAPRSCVEFRTAGVCNGSGYLLLMTAPHKKRLIPWMKNPKRDFGSSQLMIRNEELLRYF